MIIAVPIAGFIFILSGLGALSMIRQGRDWAFAGFLCALSFAILLFVTLVFGPG